MTGSYQASSHRVDWEGAPFVFKGRPPMNARLLRSMFIFFLLNGLALADPTQPLGPPINAPADETPPNSNKATFRATSPAPRVAEPPPPAMPVNLAQFQTPADPPPVMALPPERQDLPVWVDAEVLLWWMRSANLPPLITASPAGTARADVGVLGTPGTSVLFGGPVNSDLTAGGRIGAGYWFDDARTFALEGYFFQLLSTATHASAGSPGNVARPFFNAATGMPDAQLVSLPGVVDGAVQAGASSGSLLGAGALVRTNLFRDSRYSLDALIGYRYLSLSDNVAIAENLTSTDPTGMVAPLGTNLVLADHFHTANYFHGGDVGFAGSVRWNAWTLEATTRVALGSTLEHVDINGATSITVPGFPPVTSSGGLLALSSNSGVFSRNVFAVVPETRIHLAYDINASTRIHLGYSFLYWSRVARAGDQIDLAVNPGLLPPPLPGASPLRPAFSFQGTSFWAQGIDVGLSFRF
jgi:Putative beta barrel porin-7 (BBP7)